MNKSDLIDALSERLEQSRKEAGETVDAVIDEIKKAVAKGEKVAISGFGVFERSDRAPRTARNPRTGEEVKVAQTRVPRFRPGNDFKALVSGARRAVTRSAPESETPPAKKTTLAKKTTAAKKSTAAKKTTPARKATAAKKTTARKTTASTVTKATTAKAPAKKSAAPAKKSAAPAKKTAGAQPAE